MGADTGTNAPAGRLAGRVAMVTGAASGIGAACARRFACEGATIAGIDVAAEPGPAWAEIAAEAPDSVYHALDVRDAPAIARAVTETESRLGGIDVLVNAAGVSSAGGVDVLEEGEWDRVLDINLKGTFLCCKHVVPGMRTRGRGSVINLASIEGLEGFEAQAAYNASKGGVVLLTRNMAIDLGADGVRVNCLCPGLIETPMTAPLQLPGLEALREKFISMHMLGRAGRPEEVAGAALFLASDDASFVSGHALVVDGGFTAGRRLSDVGAPLDLGEQF